MSSLLDLVNESIEAGDLKESDAATAELARTYARDIDAGGDLTKLGPALLAVLEALHMSPRARNAAKKAVNDGKPSANPIDDLANARARLSRAAAVHPTLAGSEPA